jgi:carboxymethylenebutenolidase
VAIVAVVHETVTPEARELRIPLAGHRSLPAVLAVPEGEGPWPAVVVIHEAFGLNDDIRRIARRFAANGYVALAPDLLDGLGPKPFCLVRFARGIGRRRTGRPYRQLEAARAWLAGRPEVDGERMGVAGFCIGGGLALLWAADAGPAVRVAAPFYAAVPDEPEAALRGSCAVVASYGGRDRFFGGMAARLEPALDALGVPHDVKVYPEAGHSFMNEHRGVASAIGRRLPMHAGLHEPSAEDAWRRMLAFFGEHLGERRLASRETATA